MIFKADIHEIHFGNVKEILYPSLIYVCYCININIIHYQSFCLASGKDCAI